VNISSNVSSRSLSLGARAGVPARASQEPVELFNSQPPVQQPPMQQPQPTPPNQPEPPAQPALKDWTVLIYSVSDNNLYSYMQSDLDEAERVGTTAEMNIVAETSHQPRGGSVVRYELQSDATPGLKSPVIEDLGKAHDMAKAQNMGNSIAWAMEKYPSKHFFLIASDHGSGWQGAHHSESQHSWMNAGDLEEALRIAHEKSGRKIDVLGFDQCLMASTEIAHQLQPYADILVASEEVEGGAGWQYDQTLGQKKSNEVSRILTPKVLNYAAAALRSRDPLTPEDMAKAVVSMAEGNQRDLGTMSAIDLRKMPALSQALDNFAGQVIESNLSKADLQSVAQKTQKFYDFADMGHFVQLAGEKFGGEIGLAAEQVKQALTDSVIAEQHSSRYPNATGLNIEIDRQRMAGQNEVPNLEEDDRNRISFAPYSSTRWAQDTRWDEMLQKVR
jgi:hypothetical protein